MARITLCPQGAAPRCCGNVVRARWLISTVLLATALAGWALSGTAQAAVPAAISLSLSPATVAADGTSTSKATIQVTDASVPPVGVAGEKVALSATDPGEAISSVSDAGNGTYTATIRSSTTIGTPTITAADGVLSTTEKLTQIVGPPAHVAVTLNPPSIIANGISTSKATAKVTDAQGHLLAGQEVKFSSTDPKETIGTVTDAGKGTYTAVITASTTVGAATITATDGSAAGNATLTQTVGPPASITVQVSPGAIVADGTSTATATAMVIDAQGHPVPTDAITFSSSDPGQFSGPMSNAGNGTYSVEIRSSTRIGSATITAADPSHLSGQATLTQAAGPSAMSLVATPGSLVTNQVVTLFAVVSASAGSPVGTITFNSGSTPIVGCVGEAITPSNPTAACQTSFAASMSPQRLTAVFSPGPTSTAPGAVGAATVIVKQDSPLISLAINGSLEAGQATTYSATVTPPESRSGPALPSGTVEFLDNGQPIQSCQSQPLIGGTATCAVIYRTIGQHAITTLYSGDANFTGSASAALSITVVSVPVHVAGIVTSTMQWLFFFTPRYTRVIALSVRGASAAAVVVVTCHGRGCSFAKRTAGISKPKGCGHKGKRKCPTSGSVNLSQDFKGPLRVGSTITVSIRRPAWIGKYYRFVIRPARAPNIQVNCLAPTAVRPGVGCSF